MAPKRDAEAEETEMYTPDSSASRAMDTFVASDASHVSSEHLSQMLSIQAQRDELDEEIHTLHLSYLSLQSTGDANEKLLRESKVIKRYLWTVV